MRKHCFFATQTQAPRARKARLLRATQTQALLAVVLLAVAIVAGCTPQRKLIYLQDKSSSQGKPAAYTQDDIGPFDQTTAPQEKSSPTEGPTEYISKTHVHTDPDAEQQEKQTPAEGPAKHHPAGDGPRLHPAGQHKEPPTRANQVEYRLQPGDILHVRVLTSDPYSPEVINSFDIRRYTKGSGDVGNPDMYLHGHSINLAGYIHLPMVGNVHVAGRTIEEAQEIIREKTTAFLLDAVVSVKLVNFSVTVLGEVRRPGTYYLYDHNLTIMDAIGMAGDLTDYGKRQIHIIRQNPGGPVFAQIDITDRRALDSDVFYLHPNDLIYVEPHTTKRFGFAQFPFAVVFSAISTTLLLINFFN